MITIGADALRKMLCQVEPHMASDDTLPVLNSIHLEIEDGHLFAVASDRYTLAAAHKAVIRTEDTWTAMIHAADLATVLAWLKAANLDPVYITVDTAPTTTDLALTTKGSTLKISAKAASGFPQWRTLIRSQLTAEQLAVLGSAWTGRYLARWKHAADVLLAVQAGPGKPLVISDRNGDFIGMQMPVKEPNDVTAESIAKLWLDSIAPIAYVDGQRYRLDVQWSDKDGDVWEHTGRQRYGNPIMRMVGIEEDHELRQLIKQYGPIRPITETGPAGA